MKRLLYSVLLVFSFVATQAQNSVKSIYIEDWARDWVYFTTTSSVGSTVPATSSFNVNTVNPNLVVLVNDTTVGLRFASNLSISGTYDLDYSHSGSELGNLPSFTNAAVENRITMAVIIDKNTSNFANYYLGSGSDFNTVHSLSPGVKYYFRLAPGDYGSGIDVFEMTDVTFIAAYHATDSVVFGALNLREKVIHSGIIGHPSRSDNNVKIRNNFTFFGIAIFGTGNFIVRNVSIHHVVQGLQIKTVSDLPYPPYNEIRLNYQNLEAKYVDMQHTEQEGWYVGSDVAAPLVPIKWWGYGLTCDSLGRDAYQYRNGDLVYLKNCTMSYIGLEGNLVHAHGFLYGTTTKWGWVENLTGTNIRGNGMLINGYGDLTFKNVNISSEENNPYIKNYDLHDEYSLGYLTVNFICTNSFVCTRTTGDPRTPDIRRDDDLSAMTINLSNTTTFDEDPYIEDGVNGGPDYGIVVNNTTDCYEFPTAYRFTPIPKRGRLKFK